MLKHTHRGELRAGVECHRSDPRCDPAPASTGRSLTPTPRRTATPLHHPTGLDRSLRTSRSSSLIRSDSCVMTPGRRPSSVSACLTQFRSASGCTSSCFAIRECALPGLGIFTSFDSAAGRTLAQLGGVLRGSHSFGVLPGRSTLHQTRHDSLCLSVSDFDRYSLTIARWLAHVYDAGDPAGNPTTPKGRHPRVRCAARSLGGRVCGEGKTRSDQLQRRKRWKCRGLSDRSECFPVATNDLLTQRAGATFDHPPVSVGCRSI